MTISTLGILVHVTPTLVGNACRHYVRFLLGCGWCAPRESANEFLYDQLFHLISKLTIYLTHHTTEDVQKLTDQLVPVPPWCYNQQVMIPLECCHKSAALLQTYFGPEMMQSFIGGPRWWQMRSQAGIPADWIAHYSDYHSAMAKRGRKAGYHTSMLHRLTRHTARVNPRHEHPTEPDPHLVREAGRFADTTEESERLSRIVLYIHGGAYYFGSVNTHKYMIHRLTTKFGGFALAVNYRKAPQFPFPCAIQDCLAAYLYLIDPPSGAPHPAIDPSRIVVAGDSAGGGLALALLQLIRDLDLPRPAGGLLLSPWSDLTHSFPSILQNTKTDYIPPYSFLHRPSVLWPLPRDAGAFVRSTGLLRRFRSKKAGLSVEASGPWHARPLYMTQADGTAAPIKSQIQLYATNAQLRHPLCSPALAGSLGGLPPLFVLAGDDEVLRDEIVYLAHKAANPAAYPTNPALLREFPQTRRAAERYTTPTDVHLQVFDGQCHVFPMFMYTLSARYAFRAMASFIKRVTGAPCQASSPVTQSWGSAPPGKNKYAAHVPLERPHLRDHMIRERIARDGDVRPMESAEQIPCLNLPLSSIGIIYPATYARFRKGHTIWDNKYHRDIKRIKKKRARMERRITRILSKAQAEGLLENHGDIDTHGTRWTDLGAYGPADLRDETPPPSAIVARRDTPDALALLKLGLHLRAKRRHAQSPHDRPPGGGGQQRRSLADEAPRRAYSMGEHVHTDDERPVPLDQFGWWRSLLVRGRPSRS